MNQAKFCGTWSLLVGRQIGPYTIAVSAMGVGLPQDPDRRRTRCECRLCAPLTRRRLAFELEAEIEGREIPLPAPGRVRALP